MKVRSTDKARTPRVQRTPGVQRVQRKPSATARAESDRPRAALVPALFKPVDHIFSDVRILNALNALEITYVGELVQLSGPKLLRARSFGPVSLQGVHNVLAGLGLRLETEVPGWPMKTLYTAERMTQYHNAVAILAMQSSATNLPASPIEQKPPLMQSMKVPFETYKRLENIRESIAKEIYAKTQAAVIPTYGQVVETALDALDWLRDLRRLGLSGALSVEKNESGEFTVRSAGGALPDPTVKT